MFVPFPLQVRQSIDAFVALGFPKAGYTHIHLDDCWAGPRNASGFLTAGERPN